MTTRHYFSLLLLLAVFYPAAEAGAQYIKRESLPTSKTDAQGQVIYQDFAVFYAEGMPQTAQWPLGTVIVDGDNRTTRHQVNRGNGANRNINNKVSARFIISPVDVPIGGKDIWHTTSVQGEWQYASSLGEQVRDLREGNTDRGVNNGCFWFSGGTQNQNTNGKYTNRKWRMPSQRELMIMLLFQDAINAIYGVDPDPSREPALNQQQLESPTPQGMNGKIYWSATEQPDDPNNTGVGAASHQAWVVDFSRQGTRVVYPTNKGFVPADALVTKKYKLRCISDY